MEGADAAMEAEAEDEEAADAAEAAPATAAVPEPEKPSRLAADWAFSVEMKRLEHVWMLNIRDIILIER